MLNEDKTCHPLLFNDLSKLQGKIEYVACIGSVHLLVGSPCTIRIVAFHSLVVSFSCVSSARRINHPVDKENVVHDGYLKQPNNMDAKSSPQKVVNGPLAYRTQPSIQSSFQQQQQQQPLDGFRMRRGASLQPNGALFPSMGQENVFQNSKSLHQMEQAQPG